MGAAEHPHHGAVQHSAHVLHHVQDAGVGAAHENGQALGGAHSHADLVAEVVGHKALRRQAHKAIRDGLKAVPPGKAAHQPQAGERLGQAVHHPALHAVPLQKLRPKAGGQVGVAQAVAGKLRFKKMGPGVEGSAAHPLLQQVAEAGGVVIVAVAEHHRVQLRHIQPQPVGVDPRMGAGATVKKDAEIRSLQKIGQAVLIDQRLVFRRIVIHQCCDTYHFQPPPFLIPSLCFVQYRYILLIFFLMIQPL